MATSRSALTFAASSQAVRSGDVSKPPSEYEQLLFQALFTVATARVPLAPLKPSADPWEQGANLEPVDGLDPRD